MKHGFFFCKVTLKFLKICLKGIIPRRNENHLGNPMTFKKQQRQIKSLSLYDIIRTTSIGWWIQCSYLWHVYRWCAWAPFYGAGGWGRFPRLPHDPLAFFSYPGIRGPPQTDTQKHHRQRHAMPYSSHVWRDQGPAPKNFKIVLLQRGFYLISFSFIRGWDSCFLVSAMLCPDIQTDRERELGDKPWGVTHLLNGTRSSVVFTFHLQDVSCWNGLKPVIRKLELSRIEERLKSGWKPFSF